MLRYGFEFEFEMELDTQISVPPIIRSNIYDKKANDFTKDEEQRI